MKQLLTKPYLAALEKLFAAEINGLLPFQSKARVFEALAANRMAEKVELIIGAGERFPVKVSGYALTERGRLVWCEHCSSSEVAK